MFWRKTSKFFFVYISFSIGNCFVFSLCGIFLPQVTLQPRLLTAYSPTFYDSQSNILVPFVHVLFCFFVIFFSTYVVCSYIYCLPLLIQSLTLMYDVMNCFGSFVVLPTTNASAIWFCFVQLSSECYPSMKVFPWLFLGIFSQYSLRFSMNHFLAFSLSMFCSNFRAGLVPINGVS